MKEIIIDRKHEAYEPLKAMQKLADNKRKTDKKGTQKGLHYIHYNGEIGRFEASDGRALLTFWWSPEELEGVRSALFEFKNGMLTDSEETYYFPEFRRVIPEIGGEYNSYGERFENIYEITPYEFGQICPADYRLCTVLGDFGIAINGIYAGLVRDILPRFSFMALAVTENGGINTRDRAIMLHGGGMEYVIMPMISGWNRIPAEVPERLKRGA